MRCHSCKFRGATMPRCWVVPGLLSEELYLDEARNILIWVDYSNLMQGGIGYLRLAADGIHPGPPDGHELFPGAPLPPYWDTTLQLLVAGLKPRGYRIVVYVYDWRTHILENGAGLAGNIRASTDLADPCAIVAHSMGGLIARAAWDNLVGTGDQGLVRRIVTLGTPHQGSYAPVNVFSGHHESLEQLSFLTYTLTSGLNVTQWPLTNRRYNTADIRDITCTWPSLYELMPLLGGSDAVSDSQRHLLFGSTNWPGSIPVDQNWLTFSRDLFGPWLLTPNSMPPSWVLTTVSGTGVPTPYRLVRPELLGSPAALGSTDAGDGVVSASSALVVNSQRYTVAARHSDLQVVTATSGDLVDWVLEIRDPITPVPPVEQVPGVFSAILAGPPIPAAIGGIPSVSNCGSGRCEC